jgi:hypothetical protein
MPDSTLILCQSRLYPPVGVDFISQSETLDLAAVAIAFLSETAKVGWKSDQDATKTANTMVGIFYMKIIQTITFLNVHLGKNKHTT